MGAANLIRAHLGSIEGPMRVCPLSEGARHQGLTDDSPSDLEQHTQTTFHSSAAWKASFSQWTTQGTELLGVSSTFQGLGT